MKSKAKAEAPHLLRGREAEQQALVYLQQQGLRLLARNVRNRFGEIDLIMQDGATLVFVEVRQRSSLAFGGAAASLGARKQARLWRAAQCYLARRTPAPACRFDAVCIDGTHLQWLRHMMQR